MGVCPSSMTPFYRQEIAEAFADADPEVAVKGLESNPGCFAGRLAGSRIGICTR
jgi:hypothetical protein